MPLGYVNCPHPVDGLGRPTSAWVGTNDTPTSGSWSPTNPAGMVMVAGYVYDGRGVRDSNLTAATTYPGLGAPGRELITQDVVDALGRPTMITDPKRNVTSVVYKDTVHETRVYPGWDTSSNLPTGPTQVVRDDRANGYLETLTMSATPNLTGGAPDGSESIGSLQTDARAYSNATGQVVNTDDYFNLSGLTYTTSTSFGTLGTNFYRTTYAYDSRGRQN